MSTRASIRTRTIRVTPIPSFDDLLDTVDALARVELVDAPDALPILTPSRSCGPPDLAHALEADPPPRPLSR